MPHAGKSPCRSPCSKRPPSDCKSCTCTAGFSAVCPRSAWCPTSAPSTCKWRTSLAPRRFLLLLVLQVLVSSGTRVGEGSGQKKAGRGVFFCRLGQVAIHGGHGSTRRCMCTRESRNGRMVTNAQDIIVAADLVPICGIFEQQKGALKKIST